MRRCNSLINFLLGKHGRSRVAIATGAAALLCAASGVQAQSTEKAVKLLFTVPVPVATTNTTGGMYAYDISWVDQSTQTYYLGDRSNAAVDVVDANAGTFIRQITATPPFAGVVLNSSGTAANNNLSGPNGVVTGIVGGQTCLFAGDGSSRVVSFLLPAGTQVTSLSTKGTMRADEMAFDPRDSLLLAANNADTPPFASLISVSSGCALSLVAQISYPFATNGAEQPVWDPATGLFYQSIPSNSGTTASPGSLGLVIAINPKTHLIVQQFPVDLCSPAGLSLNPGNGSLLLGCSVVYDTSGNVWSGTSPLTATPYQVVMRAANGLIQAYVPGVGASDEVAYNSNDGHWYTGSQGSPYAPANVVPGGTLTAQGAAILGVIDGFSFGLDQLVPTFNVPNVIVGGKLVHVSGSGHSVDANGTNGWVFVPAPANNALPGCLTGCIQVFGRSDPDSID